MSALLLRYTLGISLAAAVAATPSAAAAQSACAGATLTTYLTPGFSCRLAGWVFDGFDYAFGAFPDSLVDAHAPSEAEVTLNPYAALDAAGRMRFGFTFDGFSTSVTANGAGRGDESALAIAGLSFVARPLSPRSTLVAAGLDLSAAIDAPALTASFMTASTFGTIGEFTFVPTCLAASAEMFGQAGRSDVADEGICPPDALQPTFVFLSTLSGLERNVPGADALNGTAGSAVNGVSFVAVQAVPEPASVALVAGGLALLGVVVRRRSRAAA